MKADPAVLPVKLFAAILYADEKALSRCISLLEAEWGPSDYRGSAVAFDVTDYYSQEMGSPLFRTIVSFRNPAPSDALPALKLFSNDVEDRMKADSGSRNVNIDTGYMDFDKVVLASAKQGPYKIYMTDGIWADMTLHYEKGKFVPFVWSFADFKDGRYDRDLLRVRELFKKRGS